MIKNLLRLLILTVLVGACKKDFTEIGYDTVNDAKFSFHQYQVQHLRFYNRQVEAVKSIGQPLVGLGVYRHPAYGLTTADLRITFGTTTDLESEHFLQADSILFVELRIPFFSKKNKELSTDEDPVYDVDSIFGHFPIDLKVYYNNYYFFPYDPEQDLHRSPSYFSDFDFSPLNGTLLYADHTFEPDLGYFVDTIPRAAGLSDLDIDESVRTTMSKDTVGPMFHVPLDTAFFRQMIFDRAGDPVLTDPTLFKSYFRGLYIETSPLSAFGTYMLMKPQIYLVLAYRYKFTNNNGTPDDESDDYEDHAYEEILLPGIIHVNTYRNEFYPQVAQAIQQPDRQNGADKVYVKGAAGSMGLLEMFNSTELYRLRNNNWLINQAELRLYVDETEMHDVPESQQPARLFLYKYDYRQPIADLDPFLPDGGKVDLNKLVATYDGTLHKDTVNRRSYYQFNITRHIKNILRKDSSNVRLGVRMVTDLPGFLSQLDLRHDPDAYQPFGTVLQGNLSGDRPVELIIYYTKPEDEEN